MRKVCVPFNVQCSTCILHIHLHPPMLPPRRHTNSRCRFNTFGSPRLLPSHLRNANDVPHNVGPTGSMRPPTGAHGTLLSSFQVHLAEFFFFLSSFAFGLCRTMRDFVCTPPCHLPRHTTSPRHASRRHVTPPWSTVPPAHPDPTAATQARHAAPCKSCHHVTQVHRHATQRRRASPTATQRNTSLPTSPCKPRPHATSPRQVPPNPPWNPPCTARLCPVVLDIAAFGYSHAPGYAHPIFSSPWGTTLTHSHPAVCSATATVLNPTALPHHLATPHQHKWGGDQS